MSALGRTNERIDSGNAKGTPRPPYSGMIFGPRRRGTLPLLALAITSCETATETPADDQPTVGPAAAIVVHAGQTQTLPALTDVPIKPAVKVTDAQGRPVPNHEVKFSVLFAGGTITGATTATGSDGVATLGGWTISKTPGANRIQAAPTGVPDTVVFTATGTTAFAEVSAGGRHACAVTTHGKVYCWGWNRYFQLGAGEALDSSVVPIPVQSTLPYAAVAAGEFHSCAIHDTQIGANTILCWGSNQNGKLGDNTTTARSVPTSTNLSVDFGKVTAGFNHSCALRSDTHVAYCWGSNLYGQIGTTNAYSEVRQPNQINSALPFTQIDAGESHTCALQASGVAYCWGRNVNGQLGDGTTTDRYAPVAVTGGLTFKSIGTGYQHTCGLTVAGKAYCWGRNAASELGNGTTTGSLTPVEVSGGHTFASLWVGGVTCGLTSTGAPYCWGANFGGQLGDGGFTPRGTPFALPGGFAFMQLAPGGTFTCGLTSGRLVYCWGWNEYGELGDGTSTFRLAPVRIVMP